MKIRYYGHSCFTVSSNGYTIAVDPYNSMVPGYPELHLSAEKAYCSHEHGDHNYTEAVDIMKSGVEDPFSITEISVPHDHDGGRKRGMNTIRIFEAEGKRIVHFGDIGCIPSEDVFAQIKEADAILIPVGGYYTIGPEEAADIAKKAAPKLVIPMHYKKGNVGLPVIAELNEFIDAAEGCGLNIRPMEYLEELEI